MTQPRPTAEPTSQSWQTKLLRRPRVTRWRRRLNSSRLIPGPVRVMIGGRVYASGDYRLATPSRLDELDGWRRPIVARRQRSLRARYGDASDAVAGPGATGLTSALQALAPRTAADPAVVLEVGCGGAANEPIITAALPDCRYIGADFAWAMVAGARGDRRGLPLVNADATALPFADRAVAVVVDGSMLIHVPDWRAALAESCRVAADAVVLHTITITSAPTRVIRKRAYGFWVPEVLFNRDDLSAALAAHGYRVTGTWPSIDYDLSDVLGITTESQTWLCVRGT